MLKRIGGGLCATLCASMGLRLRRPSSKPRWRQPRRVSVLEAALVRAVMSLPVYVPYGVLGIRPDPTLASLVVWMNVG